MPLPLSKAEQLWGGSQGIGTHGFSWNGWSNCCLQLFVSSLYWRLFPVHLEKTLRHQTVNCSASGRVSWAVKPLLLQWLQPLREGGGGKVGKMGKDNPLSHPNPFAVAHEWGLQAFTTHIRDGGRCKGTSLRLISAFLTLAVKTSRGSGCIRASFKDWMGWRWLGIHCTCFELWIIRSKCRAF